MSCANYTMPDPVWADWFHCSNPSNTDFPMNAGCASMTRAGSLVRLVLLVIDGVVSHLIVLLRLATSVGLALGTGVFSFGKRLFIRQTFLQNDLASRFRHSSHFNPLFNRDFF